MKLLIVVSLIVASVSFASGDQKNALFEEAKSNFISQKSERLVKVKQRADVLEKAIDCAKTAKNGKDMKGCRSSLKEFNKSAKAAMEGKKAEWKAKRESLKAKRQDFKKQMKK